MTPQDQERYNAIEYIVIHKNGYMDALTKVIGQKYVEEFLSLGFIHEGYTQKKKTWKCQELAKKYYQVIK